MKLVYLEITSWSGLSFNAEHYYGALKSRDQRVNLKKKMSAAEAVYLNRKDAWSLWKQGQLTERFRDKAELIALALRTWKEHFPDADLLVLGRQSCSKPQTVLDGPEEVKTKLNTLVRKVEKLEENDPMRQSKSFDWDWLDELCMEWNEIIKE